MESAEPIAGFYAPVHRALTEPILLGGAPRSLAIVNGTLAGAIGLGLSGVAQGLCLAEAGGVRIACHAFRIAVPQFAGLAQVDDLGHGSNEKPGRVSITRPGRGRSSPISPWG